MFLDMLQRHLAGQWIRLYGTDLEKTFLHLYADTFIQKTKKLYIDTRTQRNMAKLTEDISEVHSIMTKNIQDVLNHGERLDRKYPCCCNQLCCHLSLVGCLLF